MQAAGEGTAEQGGDEECRSAQPAIELLLSRDFGRERTAPPPLCATHVVASLLILILIRKGSSFLSVHLIHDNGVFYLFVAARSGQRLEDLGRVRLGGADV